MAQVLTMYLTYRNQEDCIRLTSVRMILFSITSRAMSNHFWSRVELQSDISFIGEEVVNFKWKFSSILEYKRTIFNLEIISRNVSSYSCTFIRWFQKFIATKTERFGRKMGPRNGFISRVFVVKSKSVRSLDMTV